MHAPNAETLASPSLAEAAREQLMRLIAQGVLRPGDRLNEVRIAGRFGISRGPVREAARALEGAGVLASRPRLGFFVVTFTPAEIRGIYEAKSWLEEAFIADIATHMPIETRRAILADIGGIGRADRVVFSETLFQFRRKVCGQLENPFLAELMTSLYRKFYIISAVVPAPRDEERQEWVLTILHGFWHAMTMNDLASARAILAKDTAHWLADLPMRFAGNGAGAGRTRRAMGEGAA
jgi:DNA-binding GntR family transcriptional regulator